MKRTLVIIEWIDSHSGRGWRGLDEMRRFGTILPCRSVGWVVRDDKDAITVTSSIAGENDPDCEYLTGCGDICIPRVAIKRITRLDDGRPAKRPKKRRGERRGK